MLEVRQTSRFAKWLQKLKDRQAKARIQVRIDRLALGNPEDTKPNRRRGCPKCAFIMVRDTGSISRNVVVN